MCQNNARTITLWHDPPETELFSGDTMSNFIGLCTENHETRRKWDANVTRNMKSIDKRNTSQHDTESTNIKNATPPRMPRSITHPGWFTMRIPPASVSKSAAGLFPCQKAPQMGTQWAPRKWMDMEMVYIWKPMSTVQVQACLESKLSAWMFSHWGQGATGRTGTVYLGGVAECCIKCQKPPLKATLRCIFSGERVLQWSPMVGVSCIWNHQDNSRHI